MGSVRNRLECRTCPFEYAITAPIYSRRHFERKERDIVFGGPGEWDNADKTRAQCTREGCNGDEAAFFQVQIRSADEPMTTFLKVGSALLFTAIHAEADRCETVHDVWASMEGELMENLRGGGLTSSEGPFVCEATLPFFFWLLHVLLVLLISFFFLKIYRMARCYGRKKALRLAYQHPMYL